MNELRKFYLLLDKRISQYAESSLASQSRGIVSRYQEPLLRMKKSQFSSLENLGNSVSLHRGPETMINFFLAKQGSKDQNDKKEKGEKTWSWSYDSNDSNMLYAHMQAKILNLKGVAAKLVDEVGVEFELEVDQSNEAKQHAFIKLTKHFVRLFCMGFHNIKIIKFLKEEAKI